MSTRPKPCGTHAAYKRHQAHRDYCLARRRINGTPPATPGVNNLIEDITFLLSCGEGEHAILKATGYAGRADTLRNRLNKYGHQALVAQVFNQWELAA